MEKMIPAIVGDPMTAFFGTEEEQEKMEKMENITKAAWREIVENPGFSALGFQCGNDYYIVSRSTDKHGEWRLTSFWNGTMPNGKTYNMDPSYHEYFGGKSDGYKGYGGQSLFSYLAGFCHNRQIQVTIC